MERKITVSVVIPVYNTEQYVARCVRSCLGQTYGRIEIICVDDGSTDDSAAILDGFSGEPTVRVIHKPNEGVVLARREGMAAAQGEFVLFLDADDYLPETALEELSGLIASDVDIVCGDVQVVYPNRTENIRLHGFEETDGRGYLNAVLMDWHGWACGKLFRRSLLMEITLPPHLTYNEDMLMCVEMALRAQRVRRVPRMVYFYFQHSGSVTRNLTKEDLRSLFDAYVAIVDRIERAVDFHQIYSGFFNMTMQYTFALLRSPSLIKETSPFVVAQLRKLLRGDPLAFVKHMAAESFGGAFFSLAALFSPRVASRLLCCYVKIRSR